MDFQYQFGDETQVVKIESSAEGYLIQLDDHVHHVRLNSQRNAEFVFTVDGTRHTAHMVTDGPAHYVAIDGCVVELSKPDSRRARRRRHRAGEDSLSASMPGQVAKLLVAEGDTVERNQTLLVLEAMKMEIKIAAPYAGHVTKVLVRQGQVVDRGQGLIEVTSEP